MFPYFAEYRILRCFAKGFAFSRYFAVSQNVPRNGCRYISFFETLSECTNQTFRIVKLLNTIIQTVLSGIQTRAECPEITMPRGRTI